MKMKRQRKDKIIGADGARFITIINNMLSDIRRLVM